MFKHVLVAVDFSPAWEKLRQRLHELQAWGVERVTQVHVLSTRYPSVPQEGHRSHYERRLAAEAQVLRAKGLQVACQVRVGEPGQELVAAANEVEADLLLLGRVGHGRVHDFFFGSTAMDAARLTTRPLWLEPVVDSSGDDGGALLLATDGSQAAIAAESVCKRLAPHFERTLAVSVAGKGGEADRESADARAHLETLSASCPALETQLLHGSAHKLIVEQAETLPASLVVVGKRGRNPMQALLLGSTAESVCRHSRRSVLLVPARWSAAGQAVGSL